MTFSVVNSVAIGMYHYQDEAYDRLVSDHTRGNVSTSSMNWKLLICVPNPAFELNNRTWLYYSRLVVVTKGHRKTPETK